jgi:NADPH:quinone reductase-like Zn-dependent oxidoreductase
MPTTATDRETTMRAVIASEYGPPADVLGLADIDTPAVGDDDVLVRVHAAGVNWADWAITRGLPYIIRPLYGLRRPRRRVRGSDVAGTVAAVGRHVTRLRPGDAVFGWCAGAFAEYARADARKLAPKPAGLTFEQAAAVPEAGVVALQALRDVARLRPGQKVLVNGASGGIGTFAVQLAKAFGADVTGVCSTANLDLVRSIGADRVIDYTREDFTTRGERYDLILDIADTHPLSARRRALTPTGTLIPNSGEGGRWTGSAGRVIKARLLSPFVSQRLRPFVVKPTVGDLDALGALVDAGTVTPVVGGTYPLHATAEAVEHVGRGHTRGKVVITVGSSPWKP